MYLKTWSLAVVLFGKVVLQAHPTFCFLCEDENVMSWLPAPAAVLPAPATVLPAPATVLPAPAARLPDPATMLPSVSSMEL